MATLEANCRTAGSVTLVEVCVTAARPRRVRVENRLEGPVWPPRSDGVPEPGWDGEGFEGRVAPDDRLVLGYASPADPVDPPARIADEGEPGDREPTPQAVVKALGRREPPRAAMPGGADGADSATDFDGARPGPETESDAPRPGPDTGPGSGSGGSAGNPVDAWFAAVEGRLEAAEDLVAATSVEDAEAAVERAGGIEAVRRLQKRVQEDRAVLDRLDRRCSRARERAEAVDVPVEALARLA
jgi:hypothetical protein